ncbi:terpene synthase family protein [Polymorphospora rubra]|uniref:Terpene synthase n=1 Tax=Polymorphospora rubra TaxID=338584 RepID=A0A810N0A7_9ACTN|nr:terpene synthase [Polymorphospora rubra]BCJ65223.1 hypothetical protein Prubr_22440 [Polymorphospora rubra]
MHAACPIPPRISPYADEVQRWLVDWVRGTGLPLDETGTRRLASGGFARYAGRLYPTASADDLRTLTALFTWFFLIDDAWDGPAVPGPGQLRAVRDEILTVLRTGAAASAGPDALFTGPLHRMLVDAWREPYDRLPPAARTRFVDAVAHHLDGVLVEAGNKATGRRPGIAEYVELRRATSAAYVSYTLIEFATGSALPDRIHRHPLVREIATTANDLLSWFNDVVSLEHDTAVAGGHNLVLAVAAEERLPVAEAIRAVETRWRAAMRRFTELRAALPRFGPAVDGPLAEYLDGVANSVRGTIDWSLESARYRGRAAARPAPCSPDSRAG